MSQLTEKLANYLDAETHSGFDVENIEHGVSLPVHQHDMDINDSVGMALRRQVWEEDCRLDRYGLKGCL